MDKVRIKFDQWAINGKAEKMEQEHGKTVSTFLNKIIFEKPFSFLDIGCGNGWVVRKISKNIMCRKAVGIDKSKKMIIQAKNYQAGPKEEYLHADIGNWETSRRFDFVFSMESLYYVDSIERVLKKISILLKPGGRFVCGTDFYFDNKATKRWRDVMKIQMHLHSKHEWIQFFKEAGFKTQTKNVKDLKSKKKWKRELGTLFIMGTKPKKEYSN